jgi:hypothetical protein
VTRLLAEIQAEGAKRARREELFTQLASGRLRGDAERIAREELEATDAELAAIAEGRAPVPTAPVLADPKSISREEAAKRAAEIRAKPEYWNPHRRDAEGKLLITAEAHTQLVREHSELLARAADEAAEAN